MAAGSEREFSDWVAPHLASMGFLAARLVGPADRDDVVQEALARAWQKWATFDATRGAPRSWLLAIVADRSRRLLRRSDPKREAWFDMRDAAAPIDGTRVDLERAIAGLPARMRLAVDCFYFVGLTTTETADVMGVTDGTVKSTLAKARAQLRALLEVPA
jgi:RNA polymerase sigma-70 factor (ECF subfamily)